MRVFPQAARVPPRCRARQRGAGCSRNERPLRTPQRPPEHELAALLWVIVTLLACLNAVWWLGEHIYS
jgi:hypothetical protein